MFQRKTTKGSFHQSLCPSASTFFREAPWDLDQESKKAGVDWFLECYMEGTPSEYPVDSPGWLFVSYSFSGTVT